MKRKIRTFKPLFLTVALCILAGGCLSAQARSTSRRSSTRSAGSTRQSGAASAAKAFSTTRKHPAAITACAQGAGNSSESFFFFGDEAGFLSMHRVRKSGRDSGGGAGFSSTMEGIWQVSDLPIRMIAAHPQGNLVAIYESDSFSTHRVSLWNWTEKRRLYAKRFQDSINAISWSAAGTYLMIANTSFNGITFLQGESGRTVRPFKSSPGIVNLSATGKSERSVINYAPAGRIVYTSLESGEMIEECLTEPNLYSTNLCDNNRTIVGFTESAAFAVDALDGSVIFDIDASSPVAAASPSDTEPVWFERAGGAWVLRQGELDPERVNLPSGEAILAAAGTEFFRIFGTNRGDIYVFANGALNKEETAAITQVTGICAKGDAFFFIADGNLYSTAEYGNEPALILPSYSDVAGARFGPIFSEIDSCATLNDKELLLWSSSTGAPLLRFNERTGEAERLYTSQRGITSLSVTASGIALVEGNTRAVFVGDGGKGSFAYSGTGLQDAVMVSDARMLIAKSADTRSTATLILIDVTTGETVPLNFSADICFSLAPANRRQDLLYAYAVTSENDQTRKNTELVLIRLNLEQLSKTEIETIAVYSDEDLTAKVLPLSSDRVLAALGKTGLSEIRRRNGRQQMFERAYSLPARIAATEKNAATLNYDGSITWYSLSGQASGNLTLSSSGQWLYDAGR